MWPGKFCCLCVLLVLSAAFALCISLHSLAYPPSSLQHPARVAVATVATSAQFQELREFVGSLHWWEPERSILIGVTHFSVDQLAEASLFVNAKVVPESEFWKILQERGAIFANVTDNLVAPLCKLDNLFRRKKAFQLVRTGEDCSTKMICISYHKFFVPRQQATRRECSLETNSKLCKKEAEGSCSLQLRYPLPISPNPLPRKTGKPWWCVCVATVTKPEWPIDQQVLLTQMLPRFLESVSISLSRYSVALYLGTQVDHVWDNVTAREQLIARIKGKISNEVLLRWYRYPLNPGLIDIAWKYNNLIMQAHADGCDYFYQYSDDFPFLTDGWIDVFSRHFARSQDFGLVGPYDSRHPEIMTVAACARLHLDILGYFWPPRMKNWYSDTLMHFLYGNYSVHEQRVQSRNTKVAGLRYLWCDHGTRLYLEELARSQRIIYEWALRNRPELAHEMHANVWHTIDQLKRSSLSANQQVGEDGCAPRNSFTTWESLTVAA